MTRPRAMTKLLLLLLLLLTAGLCAQTALPVTIRTLDAETGEPLGFVSVILVGTSNGGTTKEDGVWQARIPAGEHRLTALFVGYESDTVRLRLPGAEQLTLLLRPAARILDQVIVTGNDARERLERPLLGVERLSATQLRALPMMAGELDVLKGMQLTAGVSSVGEASNGVSVRGGTLDQTLLLLDGAPVFTPTHLFGLFSVFTPDALGSVDLFRANIPARYGGRLSSVVDVRTRAPNTRKLRLRGGLGLVSSRLAVETPLTGDGRLQLLAAGRLGLNDFLFSLSERLKNTESRFGDGSLKLRYLPNDRNIFTLSGFYSRDFYQIDLLNAFAGIVAEQNQYDYATLNGTLDWLRILNERTNLVTRLVRADHTPSILFPQADGGGTATYRSRIGSEGLEVELDHRTPGGHRLSGGAQLRRYRLQPGELDPGGVASINAARLAEERATEVALFAEDEWTVNPALTLSAGLRYVWFAPTGEGDEPLLSGPEPRLGASLALGERLRLKGAYALTRQYLQNIYNSVTPLPTSRWAVARAALPPQRAQLASLGLYRNVGRRDIELSLEAYHRWIEDLIEYRPGADFFLNPRVEEDLLRGEGRAYGIELGVRKETGRVQYSANYTYARSRNRVPGPDFTSRINDGKWYNGYFDQPHTFNGSLTFDDGHVHRVGVTLVAQSNRPYTQPSGVLATAGNNIPLFLERNNARLPVYHRLDFSWTIRNPTRKQRRWTGEWTVTVYNILGRRNAYNIYYQPRRGTANADVFLDSPLESYRLAIFAAPVPSLSYGFTFE